ncbi:NAD-dependent epimerase/dehydratase family protein [Saccharomonospora cyanea]|uniref:Nucleoside-diphosphate-sugar epimerase n=1 Tax=Saccharomonospora cyanea NA-134 TaxID=882082 RepID=H5XHU5_9PSEU|nr:NAD-dependent epimerase/dehydratase family protein [Saccharomonospora cyanea]EHR62804.1 nucleoside-diphosphate-sugar epimerase [Saccharomonospora cyanea NA-134]
MDPVRAERARGLTVGSLPAGTRVVVLGGSGFIGSAVAARFAAVGATVRSVSSSGRAPCADVEGVAADLTEPGRVAEVIADADVVLPLVLYTGGGTYRVGEHEAAAAARVNVSVVRSVLASVTAGCVVVFAGSTSQVGSGARDRIDGTEPDEPTTEYDRQKLAAERVVLDGGGVSLRLPTVYGPAPVALDRGVVTAMVRRALAGVPLTVWGDGAMERDLVFVDDVANAFVHAVVDARRLAGRHWLLGSGRGVGVRELFDRIAASVAAHTGRPPVPVVSVPPPQQATAMDVRSLVADSTAFTAATGWRAAVGLADGIDATVAAVAAREGRASDPYSGN